jgi:hypothetical protein
VRLQVYRRIARDVLNRTQTGLWLFSPSTGEKWISKRLRFTTAVAEAVKRGLALLPPGGGNLTVHVEEPGKATGLERFGFRPNQQLGGASGEARVEERLRQVLDAHGLPYGAVIAANGDLVARAGDFATFTGSGLLSALLGPYGSAKGTFAGLAGRPLPQMWRQGDAFAFADLPSAELAVVVFGRGRPPILDKVALSKAVQASIRSAFGAGRATERGRSAKREGPMSSTNIVGWFDDSWMPTRERAIKSGWGSLPRRDQVLLAVGFLLDSCVGDGVWAIVDGVVDGHDEGLTVRMPEALEEVGLPEAAAHVRSIIRLRAPTGSPRKDKLNREQALDRWGQIGELFEEWVPGGERVMLTKLHDWYHAQPEPAQAGTVPTQGDPGKRTSSKIKKAPRKKRG